MVVVDAYSGVGVFGEECCLDGGVEEVGGRDDEAGDGGVAKVELGFGGVEDEPEEEDGEEDGGD